MHWVPRDPVLKPEFDNERYRWDAERSELVHLGGLASDTTLRLLVTYLDHGLKGPGL
jgi:hypothetical protein